MYIFKKIEHPQNFWGPRTSSRASQECSGDPREVSPDRPESFEESPGIVQECPENMGIPRNCPGMSRGFCGYGQTATIMAKLFKFGYNFWP